MRTSEAKTQVLDIHKENVKSNYKDLKWALYFKLKTFDTLDEAQQQLYIINGTSYDDEWYDTNGCYKCLSQPVC